VAATNRRRDNFRDICSLPADPFAGLFSFLASINAALKERATRLGFASRRQSGIDRFCRKIHGVVELIALPAAAHYYPLR
jgi:hypothetical protein